MSSTEALSDGRRLLSRRQAAAHLGVSLTTFQEHVQPFVPHVALGRRILFDVRDLDGWVDSMKQRTSSGEAAPVHTPERVPAIHLSKSAQAMKESLLRPTRKSA